jgi:hypothetical protein
MGDLDHHAIAEHDHLEGMALAVVAAQHRNALMDPRETWNQRWPASRASTFELVDKPPRPGHDF